MDVAELRALIPATRESIYLNTGWGGPSPLPVLERVSAELEAQAVAGPASPTGVHLLHELTEEARAAVAGLLRADREEIALTHGTTEGLQAVLYGFPWQPGDELVTCQLEHPALGTPPAVLAERFGVTVRWVDVPPDADGDTQLQLVTDALGPRTRIVALSHIQFSCGLRMPVPALAEAVHRAGALLLIDGAQSGGHIAVDMRATGADFYAISGQKWLLGPQGTGALFVAREHARLIHPLFTTHAYADQRGELVEGAGPTHPLQRFRIASQSPALVAGLATAVGLLTDVGLDTVEERVGELADRLRTGLAATPGCTLTGPTAGSTRTGLVSVAVAGWVPRQVVTMLWERWRIVVRAVAVPPAIRISTHAFNTEAEIDATVAAIGELAASSPAG